METKMFMKRVARLLAFVMAITPISSVRAAQLPAPTVSNAQASTIVGTNDFADIFADAGISSPVLSKQLIAAARTGFNQVRMPAAGFSETDVLRSQYNAYKVAYIPSRQSSLTPAAIANVMVLAATFMGGLLGKINIPGVNLFAIDLVDPIFNVTFGKSQADLPAGQTLDDYVTNLFVDIFATLYSQYQKALNNPTTLSPEQQDALNDYSTYIANLNNALSQFRQDFAPNSSYMAKLASANAQTAGEALASCLKQVYSDYQAVRVAVQGAQSAYQILQTVSKPMPASVITALNALQGALSSDSPAVQYYIPDITDWDQEGFNLNTSNYVNYANGSNYALVGSTLAAIQTAYTAAMKVPVNPVVPTLSATQAANFTNILNTLIGAANNISMNYKATYVVPNFSNIVVPNTPMTALTAAVQSLVNDYNTVQTNISSFNIFMQTYKTYDLSAFKLQISQVNGLISQFPAIASFSVANCTSLTACSSFTGSSNGAVAIALSAILNAYQSAVVVVTPSKTTGLTPTQQAALQAAPAAYAAIMNTDTSNGQVLGVLPDAQQKLTSTLVNYLNQLNAVNVLSTDLDTIFTGAVNQIGANFVSFIGDGSATDTTLGKPVATAQGLITTLKSVANPASDVTTAIANLTTAVNAVTDTTTGFPICGFTGFSNYQTYLAVGGATGNGMIGAALMALGGTYWAAKIDADATANIAAVTAATTVQAAENALAAGLNALVTDYLNVGQYAAMLNSAFTALGNYTGSPIVDATTSKNFMSALNGAAVTANGVISTAVAGMPSIKTDWVSGFTLSNVTTDNNYFMKYYSSSAPSTDIVNETLNDFNKAYASNSAVVAAGQPSNNGSSGLSGGAITGIVFGASAAAVLLGLLVYFKGQSMLEYLQETFAKFKANVEAKVNNGDPITTETELTTFSRSDAQQALVSAAQDVAGDTSTLAPSNALMVATDPDAVGGEVTEQAVIMAGGVTSADVGLLDTIVNQFTDLASTIGSAFSNMISSVSKFVFAAPANAGTPLAPGDAGVTAAGESAVAPIPAESVPTPPTAPTLPEGAAVTTQQIQTDMQELAASVEAGGPAASIGEKIASVQADSAFAGAAGADTTAIDDFVASIQKTFESVGSGTLVDSSGFIKGALVSGIQEGSVSPEEFKMVITKLRSVYGDSSSIVTQAESLMTGNNYPQFGGEANAITGANSPLNQLQKQVDQLPEGEVLSSAELKEMMGQVDGVLTEEQWAVFKLQNPDLAEVCEEVEQSESVTFASSNGYVLDSAQEAALTAATNTETGLAASLAILDEDGAELTQLVSAYSNAVSALSNMSDAGYDISGYGEMMQTAERELTQQGATDLPELPDFGA